MTDARNGLNQRIDASRGVLRPPQRRGRPVELRHPEDATGSGAIALPNGYRSGGLSPRSLNP